MIDEKALPKRKFSTCPTLGTDFSLFPAQTARLRHFSPVIHP
jgi:hypothetical protein